MDDTTSATVLRYRPAVIVCAGLAAVGSVYYLYTSRQALEDVAQTNLQRRNAVRRPRVPAAAAEGRLEARIRTAAQRVRAEAGGDEHVEEEGEWEDLEDVEGAEPAATTTSPPTTIGEDALSLIAAERPAVAAGDDETETEAQPDETTLDVEGQRLKELAYAIAKSEHDKEGLVHHGVTCDRCQRVPIVGVRYHCANCPDFDLCEDCEATDCHLRTHVFFKVKIPAPWGGKDPLPLWYPGNPHKLPPTLEDHTWFRKELSETSGFSLDKIDGLYQQFTCMANARIDRDRDREFNYGIDRASFSHCFTQQIMTERKAMPSLIQDRLFAMFDSDRDGIISFKEFVMGTSIVHKKDPAERRHRVFTGLDLDDDGYLSRKDCLRILRSFYDLNKEVLLGYLKVDRTAENADNVGTDTDPKDHIRGGRSLAAYFTEGVAVWTPRDEDLFTEGKRVDAFGDYVPEDEDRPATCEDSDEHDYLSQRDVATGRWRDAHMTLHDEMLRLCSSRPMNYLSKDVARGFESDPGTSSTPKVREIGDDIWISDLSFGHRTAYLRVEESILEALDEDWRHKLQDTDFLELVHTTTKTKFLTVLIPEAIRDKAEGKIQHLEERGQFMLEEGNSSFPSGFAPETQNLGPGDASAAESSHPNGFLGDTKMFPPDSSLREDPLITRNFIGGTAATHTIYNVINEALNELLDPIFDVPETLALRVQSTAVQRAASKKDIDQFVQNRIDKYWTPYKHLALEPNDFKGDVDERIQMYRRLMVPNLPDGSTLVSNWALMRRAEKEGSTPGEQWEPSDQDPWECTYWSLRTEAEIFIEAELNDKKAQSTDEDPWLISLDSSDSSDGDNDQNATSTDPTMPQNRPNREESSARGERDVSPAASVPTAEPPPKAGEPVSEEQRIFHLAMYEAVARHIAQRPGPGLVTYKEFSDFLDRRMDGEAEKLLGWIGGWLDLVMF